jgi:hypothetical protein
MKKGRGSWRFASMHAKIDGNAMLVSQACACRVNAIRPQPHKLAIWIGKFLINEPQHGL